MHQKLAPDPFLILLNNLKQPLHARNSFKNEVFWKRTIKKPLKSLLYLFFLIQSLLMDKVIKNKRGLELGTSRSSGHKTSSEKLLYSLHIIWPILMMQILSANLCKSIHDIVNYSISICPLESGKCGKEAKKITKIWISREWKELFRWNKKHFS